MGWKPPTLFDKVNFVYEHWADPCDAPFTVYVKTAAPAALEMLITYFTLLPADILMEGFRASFRVPRQKSTRKGRKGKKNKRSKWRRRAGRVIGFDPNEQIGRRLSDFFIPNKQTLTGPTAAMFIVGGLIERIAYQYFVLSLLTDFLYDWTSNLFETIYCQAQGDISLVATNTPATYAALIGWDALLLPDIEKQRGPVNWNVSAGRITKGTATVFVKANLTQLLGEHSPTVKLRVRFTGGPRANTTETVSTTLEPFGTGELSLDVEISPLDPFVVEVEISIGFVEITEPYIGIGGRVPEDE